MIMHGHGQGKYHWYIYNSSKNSETKCIILSWITANICVTRNGILYSGKTKPYFKELQS